MLGIESINFSREMLIKLCEIDEFKGLWSGLERHTTALNMLGEFADYGANFARVLEPLKDQTITVQMIQVLHKTLCKDLDDAGAFRGGGHGFEYCPR